MISFTFPQRAGRARAGTGHGSAGPQTGGTARTVRRQRVTSVCGNCGVRCGTCRCWGLGAFSALPLAAPRNAQRRAHLLLLR